MKLLTSVAVLLGLSSSLILTQPPQAAWSANTRLKVAYTDIHGTDAEQAIKDLGALGVFDSTSGAFRSNDPITRGEFVRWAVRANNAIFSEREYRIRLPQTATATFADVPATDRNFKYIQALADAGYAVGTDATHFGPDEALTREQMIAIKASMDERTYVQTNGQAMAVIGTFSDGASIDRRFLGAVYEDSSAATTRTFNRVYGSSAVFQPRKVVTRGEAALALSVMRGEWPRSAADVLKQPQ